MIHDRYSMQFLWPIKPPAARQRVSRHRTPAPPLQPSLGNTRAELRGDFLILHIASPRCLNTSPEYFSAHSPRCGTDRRTFSSIIPVKGASVVGGWWLWREIKSITKQSKHQYRNNVCYSRFSINRNVMEMISELKLGAKWVWCCSGSFLDILCMES